MTASGSGKGPDYASHSFSTKTNHGYRGARAVEVRLMSYSILERDAMLLGL